MIRETLVIGGKSGFSSFWTHSWLYWEDEYTSCRKGASFKHCSSIWNARSSLEVSPALIRFAFVLVEDLVFYNLIQLFTTVLWRVYCEKL